MDRFNPEKLIHWAASVYEAIGFNESHSRTAAGNLVEADLRGVTSHGLAGGNSMEDALLRTESGQINPLGGLDEMSQHNKHWAIDVYQVDGMIGHAAAKIAVEKVTIAARNHGIGLVYVNDTTHFGMGAIHSEAIAEKGFASFVSCTSSSWMVPHGGKKKRLGTNPLVMSVPYDGGIITIDKAMTQEAAGNLTAYRAQTPGEIDLISEGYPDFVVGPDGSTLETLTAEQDIAYMREHVSLRPLGGERYGHAGSGIAILLEALMVRGGGNPEGIPGKEARTAKGRVSHMYLAIADPVYSREDTLARLGIFASSLKEGQGPDMLLPGEKEHRTKQERLHKGIPYDERQIAKLEAVGKKVDSPFEISYLKI